MQVLGILQAGGQPTPEQAQLVLSAVNGIDDADALDAAEIAAIETATEQFNNVIEQVANSYDLVYVDANSVLSTLSSTGFTFPDNPEVGVELSSEFGSGGAFSLDGIHLTPRGNAFIANEIIEAINAKYNAEVPKVNIGTYGTVTPSNAVN